MHQQSWQFAECRQSQFGRRRSSFFLHLISQHFVFCDDNVARLHKATQRVCNARQCTCRWILSQHACAAYRRIGENGKWYILLWLIVFVEFLERCGVITSAVWRFSLNIGKLAYAIRSQVNLYTLRNFHVIKECMGNFWNGREMHKNLIKYFGKLKLTCLVVTYCVPVRFRGDLAVLHGWSFGQIASKPHRNARNHHQTKLSLPNHFIKFLCISRPFQKCPIHSFVSHKDFATYVNWPGFDLAGVACDISEPTKGKTDYTSLLFNQKFQDSSDFSAARALFDPLKQRKAASLAVTSKSRH